MKKLSFVLVALLIGAGIAYASSLSVPWFVDNAAKASGWPPSGGVTTMVFLKSNAEEVITCEVTYFNQDGDNLGPAYPLNTFTLQPNSGLAFRPVTVDPLNGLTVTTLAGDTVVGEPGGQEGAQGAMVPVRPRDVDTMKNGAIVVSWVGGPSDVQGMVATSNPGTLSYAHLLPPGS